MGVHLGVFLEFAGGLAIPSFSNSIQMDTYNLLELHNAKGYQLTLTSQVANFGNISKRPTPTICSSMNCTMPA